MKRLAILDDYQGAALEMADWQPLEGDVDIRAWLDGNVINEVTPVTKP